ncbi:heme exporter protein CcmD [Thalassotalea crassostreae]|uniref:heme exporter protein CcmD n=1 Tax=Thalassotalea crassostreae TaxID=1763536 RepID=UPI00083885E2|nr:heme exporter protein CcmD [Thalassotalea crassostreae]
MAFSSFAEFIAMGGYGFFVWLSYGFTATLLIVLTINSLSMEAKVLKKVRKRSQREEKLKQAALKRKEGK